MLPAGKDRHVREVHAQRGQVIRGWRSTRPPGRAQPDTRLYAVAERFSWTAPDRSRAGCLEVGAQPWQADRDPARRR